MCFNVYQAANLPPRKPRCAFCFGSPAKAIQNQNVCCRKASGKMSALKPARPLATVHPFTPYHENTAKPQLLRLTECLLRTSARRLPSGLIKVDGLKCPPVGKRRRSLSYVSLSDIRLQMQETVFGLPEPPANLPTMPMDQREELDKRRNRW